MTLTHHSRLLLVLRENDRPDLLWHPILGEPSASFSPDPEAASDFRRYTEPQLRGAKQRILRQMREELTVIVDEERDGVIEDLNADTWLMGINDLRIALSVRLNIEAESFETFELLPDEDPQKPVYAVYYWLGWLQENLLTALMQ